MDFWFHYLVVLFLFMWETLNNSWYCFYLSLKNSLIIIFFKPQYKQFPFVLSENGKDIGSHLGQPRKGGEGIKNAHSFD